MFSVNLIKPIKILEGKPVPRHIRTLSVGPAPIEIRRPDVYSLLVRIPGGLFTGPTGHLFRSSQFPLAKDQEIHIAGLSVQINRSDKDRGPEEVVYHFFVPLEDPSLRWLIWVKGTYVPFALPPVGQSITVPGGRPFNIFHNLTDAE
jgi:hypothetical protein